MLLDKFLHVAQIEAQRSAFCQADARQLATVYEAANRDFGNGQESRGFGNSYQGSHGTTRLAGRRRAHFPSYGFMERHQRANGESGLRRMPERWEW